MKVFILSLILSVIYIFVILQIMQFLYYPKIVCENVDLDKSKATRAVSMVATKEHQNVSSKQSVFNLKKESSQNSYQRKVQASSQEIGYNLREIGSNNIYSAKVKENGKRTTESTLKRGFFNVVSVFARLVCLRGSTDGLSHLGASKISQYLPEPHATFASLQLFGQHLQRSKAIEQLFKVTGTLHILVISGSQFQLTAALGLASINKFVTKKQASIFVLLIVWIYVLQLEQTVPVTRAFLSITTALTANLLNRPFNAKLTLLASGIVLFLDDREVLGSISFQLTYLATAAILFIYPIISGVSSQIENLSPNNLSSVIVESLVLDLVVGVTLAPILSYNFGYLTLASLFISPLFAILLPIIFSLVWLLVIFPIVGGMELLHQLIGFGLSVLIEWLFAGLKIVAQIELLQIDLSITRAELLWVWYGFLVLIVSIFHFRKFNNRRSKSFKFASYG